MASKELSEKIVREFKLTTLALKNKNTVYLLTILLLFFGAYSYRSLPKELFPEIVWPQIMVQTIYPGNSPEDIENLITRPLEKEIENVRGLKELTSISSQDVSMIFVEFNTDVDIEDALRRVKDAVDIGKNELPKSATELQDPLVFDIDFSEFAILNINLSGDYSVEELKYYAEYLQDEFESIPEVSKVLIEGVNDREIKVNVDLLKLEALEISFFDITNAISSENISMSGGEILLGQTRRSIRTVGEFKNIKELENIIVKSDNGNIVYLKDVAEVIDGYTEPTSFARLDKKPVVSVQIVKKGGENLLTTTDKLYEMLDKAKENNLLPEGVEISITNDQSEMVDMQLSNLENSMIMGVIFVVVVLFFFLGTRNALFVGLAIPMSIFISFVVFGAIDYRINMIVLFALILALGMLVDNAIVVVENIYRFVDNGYNPWEAAKEAVGEIAVPIIASTATTLAAFFPLALWEGIMGEFMKYLPITLIIVLTSSLFVALIIIPVISATFIKVKTVNGNNNSARQKRNALIVAFSLIIIGSILLLLTKSKVFPNLLILFGIIGVLHKLFLQRMESWFQDIFLIKLEQFYSRALRYSLKGKRLLYFFFGTILLMILTIMLFFSRMPDIILFPDADPNYVNVVVALPTGTDITGTNDFVHKLEDDIIECFLPYKNNNNVPIVESILTTVGKGDPMDFSGGSKPNQAIITVSFIDYEIRNDISTSTMMRELSELVTGKYPGVEIEVSKDDGGPPTGKPVNLEIIGSEFSELVYLTDTIKTFIELMNIEGIEGLKMNISTQNPELLIHINRDKAQRYGLSTQMIAYTLRQSLFGNEISDFKVGEDEFPILVRLKDEYRYNLPVLMNMKIPVFGDGPPVYIPLSAIADFEYSTTFSSVRRKDMDRVITLYSNIIEGHNANTINIQLAALMETFEMPAGYRYEFTGEQQEQNESSEFLANAMLIALALIMLILVTQFNSLIRTLIIISSVLFSTIGVFGGLWTFNMDFIIIMTGIGLISLAGIVVNNAIVLVDYVELLKQRKRKELGLPDNAFLPISDATECIVQGGMTRLRPVLLTAITTILGLLPMAIGLNFDFKGLFQNYDPNMYFGGDMAEMWSPMSWTVIFGLTFSTFLTLIIVPVMYRMTVIGQKKMMTLLGQLKPSINNTKNSTNEDPIKVS